MGQWVPQTKKQPHVQTQHGILGAPGKPPGKVTPIAQRVLQTELLPGAWVWEAEGPGLDPHFVID